jgi:outer membrane protein TolC
MRTGTIAIGWLFATTLLTSWGCAGIDPSATVTATTERLAASGVDGAGWQRSDEAARSAVEASRRLLEQPLTPEVATRVALLRSHELQAELAALGIAHADLVQATRLANPGWSFERISGGGTMVRTSGVAANVVDWLTQPLRRRMAEAEVERVKLEVAGAVFDRVAAARQALIDLRYAVADAELRSRVEESERAAADYAVALHEAGNLTLRERSLVEASWLERKAELADAVGRSARAEEALRRALGLGPADAWVIEPLTEAPAWTPSSTPGSTSDSSPDERLESLEDEAVHQRLDLSAARWSVATLDRARNLRRKTRWLPAGVELGVVRETETGGVRLTGPTVELALPIFDSGRASLARYDAEILRARSQLAGLEMQVRSEVREARGAYLSAREIAELYRDTLLPLRRQALDLTVRESHQMLVGVFEVLAAKQDLLDAELRRLGALADAWRAQLELQSAVGSLLEARHEPRNASHTQPETYR